MREKKIVAGDYIDPETKVRFIEDDRGNYHVIPNYDVGDSEVKVLVDTQTPFENENKRLIRVTEKLRSENNWLWSAIEDSRKIWKDNKNPKKAMEYLEKVIKERRR